MLFLLAWFLIWSIAWSPAALATHEADHRYWVTGYVLDENEKPLGKSTVTFHMQNKVIGTTKTSSKGFYNHMLHLHDNAHEKFIRVRTAAGSASIRVKFTPGDKVTKREHHANFIAGKLIEGKRPGSGFPMWGYGAIAVVVIVPAALMVGRRSKRAAKRSRKGKGAKGQKQKKKR